MAKYRGVTWQNAGAGPKVKIRRSIWLAELQDFGAITDDAVDLPTAGAVHRAAYGGSKSGTREFVDLSTVNDLAVVDTQDHGLIGDTATTLEVWPSLSSGGGAADPNASYVGPELNADYGLDFSPSNNHLEVAQADASGWFGNSTGWSIELWIRHTSPVITTADAIMGQFGNISLTSTSGGNEVVFKGNLGLGTEYIVESSNGINDTDWHHIHVGYDGTEVRMFIDGTEVGSMMDANRSSITSIAVDDSNTNGDFLIGAREATAGSTSHYWDGEMADIHITSGSASHARTSNYDTDDIYAPTSTDETKLLIYGTLTGWSNSTTTTVTEATATGGTTPIGFGVTQPWAGFNTTNVTFTAAAQLGTSLSMPRGIEFNNDGTMIYYVSGGANANCKVIGASLGTAYDISSLIDAEAQSYDAVNDFANVDGTGTNDETNLVGVGFNPEGNKMWLTGNSYRTWIQFNLSTAWDVSTASANVKSTSSTFGGGVGLGSGWVSSTYPPINNLYGIEWHNDGYKVSAQALGRTGTTSVVELSTEYDLTTRIAHKYGSMVQTTDTIYSDLAFTSGGAWNHNGTERYAVHTKYDANTTNGLNGYEIILVKSVASTPYDSTTFAYSSSCSLTGLTNGPIGYRTTGKVAFSPNGKKLFVLAYEIDPNDTNFSGKYILEYAIG